MFFVLGLVALRHIVIRSQCGLSQLKIMVIVSVNDASIVTKIHIKNVSLI